MQIIYDFLKELQPLSILLMITIQLYTLYLLIKSRPRKVKKYKLKSNNSIIINWSGHPLPQSEWLTDCKIVNQSGKVDFNVDSFEKIEESCQKLYLGLAKDVQNLILTGSTNVVFVIPQLASGAIILIAYLHGLSGYFPLISSPLRKDDGSFWLPEPVSLSELRMSVRKER